MATDAEKAKHTFDLMGGMIVSMATSAYNILGDAALAFGTPIGSATLKQWEKEMGLEIAGEDPLNVIKEIARIWVDEYGTVENVEVISVEKDKVLEIRVHGCVARALTDTLLQATGMDQSFVCPISGTFKAALLRMGYKFKTTRKPLDNHGSIFIFEAI